MKQFLVAAIMIFVCASCTKEEKTVTREDEMRQGRWKMVAGTQRWDPAIGPDTVINYYESLPPCKKDDYLVFKTSFLGTQNSESKCDLSEPDEVDFRWELFNNGKSINFWNASQTFLNQEAVTAPFIEFSSSKFTIRYMNFVKNGFNNTLNDTVTFTYTFQKF